MSFDQLKLSIHRLLHWEYWPMHVIYASIYFLWIWYIIRFRHFHFFRFANPAIRNGGLYGVSKKDIYNLLPEALYPTTVLVKKNEVVNWADLLNNNNLHLPVIAKPDYGYRGTMVKKVASVAELEQYANEVQQDFLVQELIHYPNEIGLFYVRMPNEKRGKITGITLKNMLTITGDGQQTMAQLLAQNPRYAMQMGALKRQYDLQKVLAAGESLCLVPYGNHNRGTEFWDGSHLITPGLEDVFDQILSQIKGFYYGRLDIRYRSFEELEKGQHFSIIELNGVMGEPTHIYDPKHSFWYAQKEIIKHHRYLGKIVQQQIKAGS